MIRNLTQEETRLEEAEVRALLGRAVELKRQAEEAGAANSASGSGRFTMAEVAQIAAEVGIEPRYVEAAYAERAYGSRSGRRFQILGGPTAIEREILLPGVITPEKWERIVPELRRAIGKVGVLEQIGRSFSWTSPQEFDHVALMPEGEGTRLRLHSDPFIWFLIYVPGLVVYMISVGLVSSLPFGAAVEGPIATGAMAGIFSLQRHLMGRLMRRHEKAINALVARIAAILAEDE